MLQKLQKLQLDKLLVTGKKFIIYSTYFGVGVFLFVAVFSQIIIRYLLWPLVPNYLPQINQVISQSISADFQIGEVRTSWKDYRPAFSIKNIKISNPVEGVNSINKIGLIENNLLEVPQVDGVINWNSLWDLSPHFQYLSSQGVKILLSRNPKGVWNIGGVTIHPSNQDSQMLSWIMSESELYIGDLLLEIHDQFEEAANFSLKIEAMTLKNKSFDHLFNLKLSSKDLNGDLIANGEFKHRFGASKTNVKNWQGHFNWSINNLDIKQILDLTNIPARGKIGGLVFRGEYDLFYGGLTKGSTFLNADDINFYWKNSKNNLLLKHLDTQIEHRIDNNQQVLFTKNFQWSTSNTKNPDTSLTDIEIKFAIPNSSNEFTHLSIQTPYLKLEPIHQLALSLPLPNQWLKTLRDLAIHGEVKDLDAKYNHHSSTLDKLKSSINPQPYIEFHGMLREVGWNEIPSMIPGIQNLNGEISGSDSSGHIVIDSPQIRVQAGDFIAAKNLDFEKMQGILDWNHNSDKSLDVQLSDVVITNKMLSLQGVVKYLHPTKGGKGKIDLNMSLNNTQLPYLMTLLPKTISVDALKYLQGTIIDGTLESGSIKIEGDPNEIPFSRESNSKFLISSQFKNVTFRPLPLRDDIRGEWLPIEKVDANLSIKNESLTLQIPTGQFKNTTAKNFSVAMNLKSQPTKIEVQGNVIGKAGDFVKYVLTSPIGNRYKDSLETIDISGDANLKLSLIETFKASNPTNVQADLTLSNNQIRFKDLPTGNINTANILLDQKGVKSINILGNWLGGPLAVKTNNNLIELAGNVDASKLMEAVGVEFPAINKSVKNYLKGTLIYQSSFTKDAGGFTNATSFDLRQVQLDFPEPIVKSIGSPMLGNLKLSVNNGVLDWQFKLDNLIQSAGTMKDELVTKHALAIGNTLLPLVDKGLKINLDLVALNLDKWNQLLDKPKKINNLDDAKSLSKEVPPIDIQAKIKTLLIANKKIEDLTLIANHNQNQWKASVSAPLAVGELEWTDPGSTHPAGALKAKFSKLTIPNNESKESITRGIENSSEQMPELDIQVTNFALGNRQFGELNVLATSKENTWLLQKLNVKNPNGIFNATGKWELKANNEPSRTYLDFVVTSNNTGELLSSLGYAEVLANGKSDMTGEISWAGAPFAFSTKTLNGKLKFEVDNGKVLQVDSGAAKLLGILSLQGLFKFATLNFSGSVGEVVSTGTSFDKVSASAVIRRGNLQTNDFEMMTTPAKISMSGLVNLNQETQDLRVVIYPRINLGSAGLAVFYFTNPIIGLGTMLGQYLLSSGVNKALQSDYLIQGNWQNPEIVPLDQNGNPIDPEALKTIRRKNLLNETPGKTPEENKSPNSSSKEP